MALQFAALQSLLIYPHPCSLAFALLLSDLITFVYIAEPLLVFPPSLLVSVSLIACLACLCGRGLVRANRHALPATLGLGVLPLCLKK